MQELINNILQTPQSKTAKIIALLELGMTRNQIAALEVLGKYGATQNVYAKHQMGQIGNGLTHSLFAPTAFDRRFGVEIEAYGISYSRIAEALTAAGIECHAESYNHTTRTVWKVTTDASVGGDNAFEVVSPILVGENGLEQVRTVCAVLTRLGAKVNKSCGLHIHFDAEQMTLQNWKNLITNYATLEPTIDMMMPPSRRNNTFCQTLRIANYTQKIAAATSLAVIRQIYNSRYFKINTEAFLRHKTIEFRQHSGTFEAKKIENWILFLHYLCQYSERQTLPTGDFEQVAKFATDEVKDFYHQRIQDLNA